MFFLGYCLFHWYPIDCLDQLQLIAIDLNQINLYSRKRCRAHTEVHVLDESPLKEIQAGRNEGGSEFGIKLALLRVLIICSQMLTERYLLCNRNLLDNYAIVLISLHDFAVEV